VIPDPRTGPRQPRAVASRLGHPISSRPSFTDHYVVRPGDTLSHLARAHGVTVDALQRANALTLGLHPRSARSCGFPVLLRGTPKKRSLQGRCPPVPTRLRSRVEHRRPAPPSKARDLLIQQITSQAQEFVGTLAWAAPPGVASTAPARLRSLLAASSGPPARFVRAVYRGAERVPRGPPAG